MLKREGSKDVTPREFCIAIDLASKNTTGKELSELYEEFPRDMFDLLEHSRDVGSKTEDVLVLEVLRVSTLICSKYTDPSEQDRRLIAEVFSNDRILQIFAGKVLDWIGILSSDAENSESKLMAAVGLKALMDMLDLIVFTENLSDANDAPFFSIIYPILDVKIVNTTLGFREDAINEKIVGALKTAVQLQLPITRKSVRPMN